MTNDDARKFAALGALGLGVDLSPALAKIKTDVTRSLRASAIEAASLSSFYNLAELEMRATDSIRPLTEDVLRRTVDVTPIINASQFGPIATTDLFPHNFLATLRPITIDNRAMVDSLNMGKLVAPSLQASILKTVSTTRIASLVAQMSLDWKPVHQIIPGLTGGPMPGFDAAVRSIVAQVSEILGTELPLPDEEIEYTEIPAHSLQLEPEYVDFTKGAGATLESAFVPRRLLEKSLQVIALLIIITSVVQHNAPDVLESLPAGTQESVEEVWPDAAHVPEWLEHSVILALDIVGAATLFRSRRE